jgi:DNA invertase Pin-like site-specific DNA recombinase
MRAALYARVSRDGQTVESQLGELRAIATRRGFTITHEFTDQASGAGGARDRDGLRAMLAAARRRQFDALFFWKLDRLSREGIRATLEYLEQLERCGVEYHSATEPEITNSGALGSIFVAIRSYFAELERKLISERTRAGLDRARKEGKQIGRPRQILDGGKMLELAANGCSLRAIAREVGSDPMTVSRRLAQLTK